MRRSEHWWICSILLIFTLSGWAQIHAVKHFGLDQTLFPSRIECISQTQDGHLLVGTLAGLVVYDGYRFETKGVSNGLAESSISALAAHKEDVWVGHWTGNVTRFRPSTDSFQVFDLSRQMAFSSIRGIAPDDFGAYLLNEDGRMFRLDSTGLERLLLPIEEGTKILSIAQRKGELIVTVPQGVLSLTIADVDDQPATWQWLWKVAEGEVLQTAFEWSQGYFLLQLNTRWVMVQSNPEGASVETLGLLPMVQVEEISIDLYGNIWIASRSNGVIRFTPSSGALEQIGRHNGLSYDETKSVFVDREGNVWIATSAGLDLFLGEAFRLYDRSAQLPENMVWDVIMLKDYSYVATSNGLMQFELTGNGVLTEPVLIGLDGVEVYQLCSDQQAGVYALASDGMIWKYDQQEQTLKPLRSLKVRARCLEIVNGYIWAGTDDGVCVLDPERDAMVEKMTTQTGLAGDRISGIFHSVYGNETWISALGSELTRFKEGKFKRYSIREDGAPNVIMDAAFDQQGRLWVATYDDGVYCLEDDRFEQLVGKDDIEVASSFAITIDEQGAVWMGNNGGIDVYYPNRDEYQSFSENDGFMGVEVNPGALVNHPRTGIWMGTLLGAVHFMPQEIRPNPFEPTLKITEATIGTKDLLALPKVVATFGANNDLDILFTGTSLTNPEKNRYYYRLKGLHEHWRVLEQPERIQYHALPIGDFHFELKACNNSGVCSSSFQELSFSIIPPFYRTWWFYTFLFVVIVFAIFFMDRYRTVALLDDKVRLNEIIEQKQQAYIELDQRTQELIAERKIDDRFLEGIQRYRAEREEPVEQILEGFNIAYQSALKGEPVSSKSILTHRMEALDVVVVLDTGIRGTAARGIAAELQLELRQQLHKGMSPEEALLQWRSMQEHIETYLESYRGLSWLLIIKQGARYHIAVKGIALFKAKGGQLQKLSDLIVEGQFIPIDHDVRALYAISERTFEQLNEAGTKTFSEQRFIEVLERNMHKSDQEMIAAMFSAFNKWRGAMEQFDDLALCIWNKRKKI